METCQPGKPCLHCPVGIWFCWQPWGQIPWPNSLSAGIYFWNVLWGMVGTLSLEQGNGWERTMEVCNTSSVYSHTASILVLCTVSPEEPKPTHTSFIRLCNIRSWDLRAMTLFFLFAHRMYLFKKDMAHTSFLFPSMAPKQMTKQISKLPLGNHQIRRKSGQSYFKSMVWESEMHQF